jgi:hypothetical protein
LLYQETFLCSGFDKKNKQRVIMMLQFRSPTSISLYYFVLVARSRQTGRSYNSIPGDDEVLMVVVLQIVLVIVPGVSAILRYCFFVLGQRQQSSN